MKLSIPRLSVPDRDERDQQRQARLDAAAAFLEQSKESDDA